VGGVGRSLFYTSANFSLDNSFFSVNKPCSAWFMKNCRQFMYLPGKVHFFCLNSVLLDKCRGKLFVFL